MKFEWEQIKIHRGDDSTISICRVKVIGGWVFNTSTVQKKPGRDEWVATSESNVFIPDPNHEWKIE